MRRSDRLLHLQISLMRAMKVVRRARHYLRYEFKDIAWPRPLPDPPDYDPAKKPWTWKQWGQARSCSQCMHSSIVWLNTGT